MVEIRMSEPRQQPVPNCRTGECCSTCRYYVQKDNDLMCIEYGVAATHTMMCDGYISIYSDKHLVPLIEVECDV